MAEYDIRIDTDGTGNLDYSAADDLVSFNTRRGRGDRVGVAEAGTATIVLKSTHAKYYLDRGEAISGLALGRRIGIQCIADGQRVDVFRGRITGVTPQLVEPYGDEWRAEIEAEDATTLLTAREIDLDMQRERSYAQLVRRVLEVARWKGGIRVSSVQDHGPEFAWWEDTTPMAAIQEIVEAEGGTFYIARDGTAVFEDRFWRRREQGTAKMDISDLMFNYGETRDDIITRIRVRVHEYTLRNLQEVWARGREMKLKSGDSREFYVDLTDPIVKGSIKDPEDNKDYKAHKFKDEDTNRTGSVRFQVLDAFATWAKVKIKNVHSNDDIVITKLRLRAKPIKITGPMSVVQSADDISVIVRPRAALDEETLLEGAIIGGDVEGEYMYRKHEVDNRLVQRRAKAEGLAKYLLGRLSSTQPKISVQLKIQTDSDRVKVSALEISDRVSVSNDALGISGAYWIDRIDHEVSYDGGYHLVTLELQAAYSEDSDRLVGNATLGAAALTG